MYCPGGKVRGGGLLREIRVRRRSSLRHDGLLIEMCCAGRGQQLVEPHNGLHIHVTEEASAKPAVQRQACVPRVATARGRQVGSKAQSP
jgi:hypothetical protein